MVRRVGSWAKAALVVVLVAVMAVPTTAMGQSASRDGYKAVNYTASPAFDVNSEPVPRNPHTLPFSSMFLSVDSIARLHAPERALRSSSFAAPPDHPKLALQSSLGPYVADTLDMANNSLIPGNFPAASCQLNDIVYDAGKGETFLACQGMRDVLVLSDTNDRVVAVVPVAGNPYALAYDSGKGEVFVGYQFANHIDAISDSSNSITVSVNVGQYLQQPGLAYDSGKGYIYVAEGSGLAGNVTVVSDNSNSVVTTITGFSTASGVVYDKGKGEIFVTNYEGVNVSVVNDTTNTIVASIPVGGINALSEVYDSGKGEVFVSWQNGAPSVRVISDSSNKVVANITLGWNTGGMAYDGSNGEVYVANYTGNSDNVSVISDATNSLVATLPVGPFPMAVAYDVTKREIFVAIGGADAVGVVNASTNTVTSTIQLDNNPCGVVYDNGKGEVFVADYELNSVGIIDSSTNLLVATVPVQNGPRGVAYDPSKGEVFTTDSGSNNVSVISDMSNSVVATIPVGSFPFAATYDKGKGEVFVVNQQSDNVSVISDSTDAVVANIPVGVAPYGIAYDPVKGEVFVTNWGLSNTSDPVMVINDTTNTVVATISVGPYPDGISYDPNNGEMIVADQGSANVSIILDSTNSVIGKANVGTFPQGIDYDPVQNEWFVGNWGSNNVSVLSASTGTILGNISVGANPVGTIYDPTNGLLYVSNSNQGTGTISVISPLRSYPVSFGETGLPSGTSWSATLNGSTLFSTTNTIAFTEPNGTYNYTVGTVAGYSANPTSGSLVVNGANVTKSITFTALPPSQYSLTFTETGLPTGTNWSVTVGTTTHNSTGSTVTFTEPNGTYSYTVGVVAGYTVSPSSGGVTVNGSAQSVAITFTPSVIPTYTVTFTESGLPSGTSWSVTQNGSTHPSTSGTVTFTEPNGTYSFTVGSVSGYTPSPSSGSLTVKGSATGVSITFTAIPAGSYPVTFTESGLPTGTNWSVTLGGSTLSSTTSTIIFTEPNGTYPYTVGSVSGYTASPSSGNVTVSGAAHSISITFTKTPTGPTHYTVTFTESGLPRGTSWSVTLNGTPGTSSTPGIVFNNLLNNTSGYAFTVGTVSGYTAVPSSGSVVVNGANVTKAITFTAIPAGSYSVTFTESGLPSGANWSVTLGGKTQSSTGSTLTFTEKNGTYPYTVTAPSGYLAIPTSGSVNVAGKAVSQGVTFSASPPPNTVGYAVVITESGLPSGALWSVTLNGSTRSSTTTSITFHEGNGSYAFSVGVVTGYTASPSTGTIHVNGAAIGQIVTFTSTSSKGKTNQTTGFLGLSGDEGYLLIGVVVAAVAAAVAVLLLRSRKKSPPGGGVQDSKNIADGAAQQVAVE